MTVTIDDPLWDHMNQYSEIRWSAVMRTAVEEKIKALDVLEKLMKKKKLSEKEITEFSLQLGKKVSGRA